MAVSRKLLKRFGERGRNRTFNLLIKSQLLCQLSYAPFLELTTKASRMVCNLTTRQNQTVLPAKLGTILILS